jgi:hypothetical protein
MKKVALISANIGDFDRDPIHKPQSVPYDNHRFTDENFPLRSRVMTPRLQAKIPKCFGWQLAPGYDYYLWLDGPFGLDHRDSLKHFLDKCKKHDVVVFQHLRRANIWGEYRYIRRGLWQSSYIISRYEDEFLDEQYQVIRNDKSYKDDILFLGGIFMYKNTPQVQSALKEWWYYITRYLIMDQLAFPYVLRKAGLKINVLSDDPSKWWFVKSYGHKNRRRK